MAPLAASGFFARPLNRADLLECLALQPGHIGDDIVGLDRALVIWRWMMCQHSCASVLAESPLPINGHNIVALGFDVPVASWFVDDELSNPRPGLNARFLAAVDAKRPALPAQGAVAKLNATTGLDFLLLASSCLQGMSATQISELSAVLAPSYLAARRGFRINRILSETIGPEESTHFKAMRTFREVKRFQGERCLWVSVRPEEEFLVSASFVSPLFHYQEPLLRLRLSDQELLLAALDGKTDEELSDALVLSVPAVKKRWNSIFDRTVYARPDLFLTVSPAESARRGKQKRHHVLTYVRAHPEELRPYDWAARNDAEGTKRR